MTTTYKLYRDNVLIASPSGTSYVDAGLTNGTTYSYEVSAVVNGVEGSRSAAVLATPTATPGGGGGGTLTPTVPSGIDYTGATDVSDALMAYFATVPNNSTIVFQPAPALYRIDKALKIGGRTNLIFDLNGAEIRAGGAGTNENYSIFYFQTFPGTNTGITVRNGIITGNSPTPGVLIVPSQGQHGVLVDGGSGFEIYGLTCSKMYGDFVEVNSNAANVRAHNNTVTNTGRNGLSVVHGNNVEFDHNTLVTIGYVPFDVEPNNSAEPCNTINVHHNTVATWANCFFAVDGSSTGALIHDITVTDNVCSGSSLLTVVNPSGTARESTVLFSRNTGAGSVAGPVLQFRAIDGLTVQNNVQSLSSGSLVSTTSCTAATITPNP